MSVNRHLSRTIAMQSLYEWDFHRDQDILKIAERVAEPVVKDVDVEYLHRVVEGAVKHVEEIDLLVANAAPEWPIDQISVIDKSILRLSAFELLHDEDIPPKVAINEAVEIAKTFGGENSSKFINGVLGTLYRNSDRYDPAADEAAKEKRDSDAAAESKTEEIPEIDKKPKVKDVEPTTD